MRISDRSIEEVREAANIVEVTSEFTALRRQGARFAGLCPYPDHQEKTPSFSVDPEKNLYHCFGCKKGGDAIKLVMDLKSFDFAEAVSYLAERSGVDLQFEGGGDPSVARERTLRRRAIHKALAAATVYYHKYLLRSQTPEAERARRYLRERHLERSTIEEFRLGYAPPRGTSGFLAPARRLDLDRSILDAAGLLSSRGGERFAGRITFPISDRRGRIVGFGARTLGDAQPKYLNSPETEIFNKRDLLYGFPQVSEAIRRERAALVVEGYTDVLMLYQSGIKNAVATLGTATTPAHLRTLSGYADSVCLLFDPDSAGEKALQGARGVASAIASEESAQRSGNRVVKRAIVASAEMKLDLRVLRLTQDPADWLIEHSAEEFRELLGDAVPILEYGIRQIADRTLGSTALDRSRIQPEMENLLMEIPDPILRREAIRLASIALQVEPEFLAQSVATPIVNYPKKITTNFDEDPLNKAGQEVLALILARPDLSADALKQGIRTSSLPAPFELRTGDFRDETQARIFALLREHAGDDLSAVLLDERARPLMDEIGALASEGERLFPSESSVREAWLRLGILSRERSKRETPDYDEKEVLQSEIQQLKRALRSVSTGA